MGDPHRIAIVGLGVISRAYLESLVGHPAIDIVAVCDLDARRAESVAADLGVAALDVQAAVTEPDVETILNLTIPAAHAEIASAAIEGGKHVYGEKPLTRTFQEGLDVMRAARSAGVGVGCAPDTVLGTGIQTARAAIDAGLIGIPVSAVAQWVSPGHEAWHPNPDFYYLDGGGPLLDMGPYYLTSLVHLLGPVESVQGAASRGRLRRTIGSGPRAGQEIRVDVDTHVTGILRHVGGAISTVTMSFDGVRTRAEPIEVHGERGSLVAPDPNHFDGDVHFHALGADAWEVLPPSAGYVDAARGVGVVDFARDPLAARASGDLGLHVLEVMTLLLESSVDGTARRLTTMVERPSLVPLTRWRDRA